MNQALAAIDRAIIRTCIVCNGPAARVALFVVFFWFGVLKVVAESPANPLVASLLEQTLPFITFEAFIIFFGILEAIIGVLFLLPKATRIVIPLLGLHMLTTFMPLVLLPQVTWQAFLVPTLEGQYIIKNVVIIALVIGIASHLHPMGAQYRKAA